MDEQVPGYYSIDSTGVTFEGAITQSGDTIRLGSIVDASSFRVVGTTVDEKKSIRNPYHFDGRMNCYYMDAAHIYGYNGQPPFSFRVLGKASDLELMGGAFIRMGNEVFANGLLIPSADASSFHTMDAWQAHRKSEWSLTLGLDKDHMYWGQSVMSERSLYDALGYEEDSLKRIYFK